MSVIFGINRSYYKKFKFVVEIAGVAHAGFQSCSEIRVQTNDIEHWEGGSLRADKQPGRVVVPDVTLARGATDDLDLWTWFQQVVAAAAIVSEDAVKRTLDVVQQDRAGNELRRWTLINAYPKEFKAGDWDNNTDENVVEEVVLRYDYPIIGGDVGL